MKYHVTFGKYQLSYLGMGIFSKYFSSSILSAFMFLQNWSMYLSSHLGDCFYPFNGLLLLWASYSEGSRKLAMYIAKNWVNFQNFKISKFF